MTCGKSRLRCSARCMRPADTIRPRLRLRSRLRNRLRNSLRNRPSRLRVRLRNRPSRLRVSRLRSRLRVSSLKSEPDGRLLPVRLRRDAAPASLLMSSRRSLTS